LHAQNSASSADSIRAAYAANQAKLLKEREEQRKKLAREKAIRDSTNAANRAAMQKMIAERKRVTDSTMKSRMAYRDSVAKVRLANQKAREKLAKYKSSRKYQDSLARSRKERSDSISFARKVKFEQQREINQQRVQEQVAVRKAEVEKQRLINKARLDSAKAVRDIAIEKVKAARAKTMDSIASIRKLRADTLAKKKKAREELIRKNFQTDEEKQMIAAQKKHKAQQLKYTNQLFLKKPWTLNRKIYQNTVTRYNYFYNATNRYNEALDNASRQSKDDYSKLISLNQIDLEAASGAVGGNMDSVIKKCQTSIQIHDPRSKWFDDLYLLTGKAYYLKNDLDNALLTFQFVASEYKPKTDKQAPKTPATKKPKQYDTVAQEPVVLASKENYKGIHVIDHHFVRNDALLWMLRCYLQMGALNDALNLAAVLEADKNFPDRLRGDLSLLSAQIHLMMEDKQQAIAALKIASINKDISKNARTRSTFLLAQLLAEQKDYQESTKSFERVLDLKPDVDMDFFARLYIAKNTVLQDANNTARGEAMFKKILNDTKYEKYYDQAYLTLGQLQAKNNTAKAIENLTKATTITGASESVKLQAYRQLAELYFAQEEYATSKVMYDKTLAIMKDNDPDYVNLDRRRNLLNDLVKELEVVRVNDSLLALSKLSGKEQISAVRKYIKSQSKLETSEQTSADPSASASTADPSKKLADWYFSKNLLLQSGKANFDQVWGERPNVDNWRRKSAISAFAETQEKQQREAEQLQQEKSQEDSRDAKEQQYLSAIPNTDEQRDACHRSIANSLYNIAVIYYAGLANDAKSTKYIDQLVTEYPNYVNIQQAYYTGYMANKRLPNLTKSRYYLDLLKEKFPESDLASMAGDTAYIAKKQSNTGGAFAYYDETYDMYQKEAYKDVLPRVEYAHSEYREHALLAKFDLLGAMCLLQIGKKREGKKELEAVMQTYAGSEEATFAQDLLALLTKSDSTLVDSTDMVRNLNASFDQKTNAGFSGYNYDPNGTHYFMFVVRKIDDRLNPLKSGFADYNSMKHGLDKIQSTLSLVDQNTGVLFFKKFKNAKEAAKYLKEVTDTKTLYSVYQNNEVELLIISEVNYEFFKNTRDLEGYIKYYKKTYK
jgi:hypothetical protein